ncbi:conjugative transposon protein TraM [Pontibacter mangrovi]|uniref:conjugative transposon protein TraM n=1 Tax=Pontibacter mangrovi TaxID=2589816 RepID=UPI0015E30B43|nr:conjugative transposon protein TraM [Pontibacter mangrovi]
MKDKFAAYQEAFQYRTDYSAVQEIGQETAREDYGSVYTEHERRLLDSLRQSLLPGEQPMPFSERVQALEPVPYAAPAARRSPPPEGDYAREMRLFREQMQFVDSLARAGEAPVPARPAPEPDSARHSPPPQRVRRQGRGEQAYFNTVRAGQEERFIRAMLDEGLRVLPGGRVRLRLLDNVQVGEVALSKGTYLYGTVSGFRTQRVEITVRSVLNGERLLPVDLRVYDNDGMAGVYVPDSQFRDFTRELAGNAAGSQSLGLEEAPENVRQMLYALLENMSQTTTRAAGKSLRKNKARLTYNTLVYLIDNQSH